MLGTFATMRYVKANFKSNLLFSVNGLQIIMAKNLHLSRLMIQRIATKSYSVSDFL